MDLAGIWDLIIEQGATFERYYRWEDSSGSPMSLDSLALRMRIRATKSSVVIASSYGSSATIVLSKPGDPGVIKVLITAADTSLMNFTRAVYDIEAYDTSTPVVVYRIVGGRVELSREVTY